MAEVELPNPDELQELKEKSFTRRVALTTAFFAVLLAITSLGGSNAMKEMILMQQQASDQWAFYQAKVIREHLYRSQKMRVELDLLEGDSMRPAVRQRLTEHLQKLTAEEERYRMEKKEIEQAAKKLEAERDLNLAKDPYFDYAEVLLQIAIVMASIAIISSSRAIFWFALGAAGLGGFLSLNGFFLFARLPFFH